MLYDINFFWDGRYPGTRARADSCNDGETNWVRIEADDAASTTIHVGSAEHANALADLINTLVSKKPEVDRCEALVGERS